MKLVKKSDRQYQIKEGRKVICNIYKTRKGWTNEESYFPTETPQESFDYYLEYRKLSFKSFNERLITL